MKVAGREVQKVELVGDDITGKCVASFGNTLNKIKCSQELIDFINEGYTLIGTDRRTIFDTENMVLYYTTNVQLNGLMTVKEAMNRVMSIEDLPHYWDLKWDIPTLSEISTLKNAALLMAFQKVGMVLALHPERYLITINPICRISDQPLYSQAALRFTGIEVNSNAELFLFFCASLNLKPDLKEFNDEFESYTKKINQMVKNFDWLKAPDYEEIAMEIARGDNSKKLGEQELKFYLTDDVICRMKFCNAEISDYGYFFYSNKDIEFCTCIRDKNKNIVKNGISVYGTPKEDKEIRHYKNDILDGKSECLYANKDNEIRYYKNGVLEGKSEYTYANGDKEIREYKNGVLEGKSEYIYANGDKEVREYKNGVLTDESIY